MWGCVGFLLKFGFISWKIKGNDTAPQTNNGITRIIGKPSGTIATNIAIAIMNWSTAAYQISTDESP